MVKKISNVGLRGVSNNSRHIRWNVEQSPENMIMDSPMNRYHFVIVDDRDRKSISNRIVTNLAKVSSVILIREIEGKVKGTKFRYLFVTYDSPASGEVLNLSSLGKPLKKDIDLYERVKKKMSIEDYVMKEYGG